MIKMLRLDERLIHGQVAIKWSRHLGVDRIVVIDDTAAKSELIQKSLLMAAPPTVKVAIKDLESGLRILLDPRSEKLKILVIVSSLSDLLTIAQQAPGIELINVGNYGRLAPKKAGENRKMYRANLYLYNHELEIVEDVTKLGTKAVYQTIPDDTPDDLSNIVSKLNK